MEQDIIRELRRIAESLECIFTVLHKEGEEEGAE